MSTFSEYELAIRLQKGDVTAFDIIYRKYQNSIFLNIFKLTRDEEASRDILQEVFVVLWTNRASIDPDQSLIGWLFKVSFNLSVSYLKKKLRQAAVLNSSEFLSLAAEEPFSEIADLRSRLVKEAIEQLSPQKRRVFELCKIQGKTYEETAKELNISKHTVNEYLVLAIQYIRSYIRQHPEYQSAHIPPVLAAIFLLN